MKSVRFSLLIAAILLICAACSEDSKAPTIPRGATLSSAARRAKPLSREDLKSLGNFDSLSADSLVTLIRRTDGRVAVGIKDAGSTVGYVRGHGRTTSEASFVSARKALEALGLEIRFALDRVSAIAGQIPYEEIRPGLIEAIRKNPSIWYVHPDVPVFPLSSGASVQTASCGSNLDSEQIYPWGVERIQAPLAWKNSTGAGQVLQVIDLGVDESHPDLTISSSASYCGTGCSAKDDVDGHGTRVTGIGAAKKDEKGVVGVAPDVTIANQRVCSGTCPASNVSNALNDVPSDGVVNMSLETDKLPTLVNAIDNAYSLKNIVLVAGAGNLHLGETNTDTLAYPASDFHVIAVAATNASDAFYKEPPTRLHTWPRRRRCFASRIRPGRMSRSGIA